LAMAAQGGEEGAAMLSRRSVGTIAAGLLFAAGGGPQAAQAFITKGATLDGVKFAVPSGWKGTVVDGGLSFADPVSGPVGAVSVVVTPAAGKASIKDLGKIERINFVKALGADVSLKNADMVAAEVRKSGSGTVYYKFVLALAPKECSREKEMVPGSCMYDKIALLSGCVKDGTVYLMQVFADADQWKKNGPALREVIDSMDM